MIFQKALLVVLFNLVATSVDSFSISKPSSVGSLIQPFKTSTCLRAEEESETEIAEEEIVTAGEPAAATDILNSKGFLTRKLDVIKSDVEKAEEDIAEAKKLVDAGKAEWEPQLEALKTEFKTMQTRMSTQNKKGDVMATQLVVREMLEMMDTMDRGFGVVKAESEAEQAIMDEYKEVYQNILDTFEKLGVTQVETLGKEFDYEVHQAVMQRPSEDYEEGIVCDELQKGFMIGETLIRAAMVSVAA